MGVEHACAVVSGGVLCWGSNDNGQLGTGSDAGSGVPVPVQGLGSPGSGVQAIAAGGFHTCAIVNGGAFCWGDNADGDLGDLSYTPSNVPVAVLGLGSGVQALAVGYYHSCALVNGGVQCWGDGANGQLGGGANVFETSPAAVVGLGTGGVQAIAAGDYETCALVGGAVECWGDDMSGDLGNNSTTTSYVPVPVSPWQP